MAKATFDPDAWKRERDKLKPAPPAERESEPAPVKRKSKSKRKPAKKSGKTVQPVTGTSTAGAKHVKLIDTLSLAWEPPWGRILHDLGITNYRTG